MLKKLMFGAVALAAVLPAASQAQEQPSTELVLYPKGNYKGAGYSIAGASQSMRVFPVRSVKIPEGMSWELCSGNTFTGCTEFTKSDPGMIMNVRSVRPVAPKITTIGAAVGTAVSGPNHPFAEWQANISWPRRSTAHGSKFRKARAEAMTRRARDFCPSTDGGWRSMRGCNRLKAGAFWPTCFAPTMNDR